MIDYHTRLVSALKTIGIPVKYELTLSRGDATPLISYIGLNNYVIGNGDTVGYSRVQYQIKVWGTDIADLQKYAKKQMIHLDLLVLLEPIVMNYMTLILP